jgi:hypothetical protein
MFSSTEIIVVGGNNRKWNKVKDTECLHGKLGSSLVLNAEFVKAVEGIVGYLNAEHNPYHPLDPCLP